MEGTHRCHAASSSCPAYDALSSCPCLVRARSERLLAYGLLQPHSFAAPAFSAGFNVEGGSAHQAPVLAHSQYDSMCSSVGSGAPWLSEVMQTELYQQTVRDLEANVAQENNLSHIVIW